MCLHFFRLNGFWGLYPRGSKLGLKLKLEETFLFFYVTFDIRCLISLITFAIGKIYEWRRERFARGMDTTIDEFFTFTTFFPFCRLHSMLMYNVE